MGSNLPLKKTNTSDRKHLAGSFIQAHGESSYCLNAIANTVVGNLHYLK